MNRTRRWVFAAGGAAVAGMVAALVLNLRDSGPQPATVAVTRGTLTQEVQAVGRVRPQELVAVGAQVSGRVERLFVRLGQHVQAGEPIAQVDAQPQQLALRSAEAAVAALQAQLAARRVALTQARVTQQRQQMLADAQAGIASDLDAAQAAVDSLAAEVDALRAQVAQARTQVETARTQLGYTRIVAPMEGVVVSVVTKQGQTLNAYQSTPTIVMLAKLDVMTVRAEISEADVNLVAPGMEARFTTLGANSTSYMARIAQIEPAPESIVTDAATTPGSATTGSATKAVYYNALFDVSNADGKLRPSMTVQVTVRIREIEHALLVPATALRHTGRPGWASAQVLDRNGRVSAREVQTGLRTPLHVQVLAGLTLGERVVVGEPVGTEAPVTMGTGLL